MYILVSFVMSKETVLIFFHRIINASIEVESGFVHFFFYNQLNLKHCAHCTHIQLTFLHLCTHIHNPNIQYLKDGYLFMDLNTFNALKCTKMIYFVILYVKTFL